MLYLPKYRDHVLVGQIVYYCANFVQTLTIQQRDQRQFVDVEFTDASRLCTAKPGSWEGQMRSTHSERTSTIFGVGGGAFEI